MAANLYPGIKALHLILDTPYDLIRTDDIRDDLVGVKVWISTTNGFNHTQLNPVFDGMGLSITISNLEPNTRYYVKYAFISAIEPSNFTVSQELTALVYDENVRVYGYLTNDPTGIATQPDGTGGDFSLATGTFKVYSLSQDVTGNGPVYSIKTGSVYHLSGATIDETTGVYSCTGMTQNSGSVTFLAVYDGIEVEQVWNVYRGVAGASAPLIQLSATNIDFVFKDEFATTPETSQTVLTAALKNITGTPVFTAEAYTRAGVSLGSVSFTQAGNQITITGAQFSALGVTVGAVVVTATIGTVSDSFTIYRINDGTEQITVELSNSAHVIPAANNGATVEDNYAGSGTTIKVKQGNTYLPVDSTSPYETFGSWNIFEINPINIIPDPTPTIGSDFINFDTHATMTADSAYIEYVILYRTTSGVEGSQRVVQSFAKSKEGVVGASAPAVSITAPRLAFVTLKNNGGTIPPNSGDITLTATVSNITNPEYSWTVDGVAVGTNSSTYAIPFFDDVGAKKVQVDVSGTGGTQAFDVFSVYHIAEGSDTIAVGLSNENQTISCDSTGTPIAGQFPITITTGVFQGIQQLSSTSTPAVVYDKVTGSETGMTSSINSTTGVITINSITEAFAEVTYSFTVGTVEVRKTITLNKSIDGASAPIVRLAAEPQVFVQPKNTGTPYPSTTTLTATEINIPNAVFAWYVDDVLQTDVTIDTLILNSFAPVASKLVKVVATGTGGVTAFDQLTLYSIAEGDDSYQAGITNESRTLTANSSGTIYGGQLPVSGSMAVVRGTDVYGTTAWPLDSSPEPEVSFSVTPTSLSGLTASITNAGIITISGTSFSANSAEFTFTATITTPSGNVQLSRKMLFTKTRDGKDAVIIDLVSETDVIAAANDGTGYALPTGNSIKLYRGGVLLTTGVTYAGTATKNGLTLTVDSGTGAITLSGTSWTSDTESFTVTATYSSITYTAQYTISKSKAGTDAILIDLVYDADVVAAANDGTGYTLPTGNSIKLYKGGVLLTTGVTYAGTTTKNGLTLTVSAAGAITLSGTSWTSNTESFTVTATYNSVVYSIGYSISKSKQGLQGQQGIQGIQGLPGLNGTDGTDGTNGTNGLLGINTKIIYILLSQTAAAPSTPANTTNTAIPSGWTAVTTAINPTVGTIVWYSYGRVNNNSVPVDGVPQLTTVWSVPTAASVFQDIRSDNWNGSSPPVITQSGTWGTAGYYLSKANGSVFADGFFARGNVVINGSGTGINYQAFAVGCDVNFNKLANIGVAGQGGDSTSPGGIGVVGYLGNNLETYPVSSVLIVEGVRGIVSQNPLNTNGYNVGIGVHAIASGPGTPLTIPGSGGTGLKAESSNGKAVHAINIQTYGGYAIYAEGNSHFIGAMSIAGNMTITGTITADQNIVSYQNVIAYQTSDINLKENITKLINPLEKLTQLGGYEYDWKQEYLDNNQHKEHPDLIKKHDIGVIAQEVEKVLPEAVITRKDGTLAVNYEKLIPLLIEAIKELDRRTR